MFSTTQDDDVAAKQPQAEALVGLLDHLFFDAGDLGVRLQAYHNTLTFVLWGPIVRGPALALFARLLRLGTSFARREVVLDLRGIEKIDAAGCSQLTHAARVSPFTVIVPKGLIKTRWLEPLAELTSPGIVLEDVVGPNITMAFGPRAGGQ